MATAQESIQLQSPTSTFSLADSLAKLSASLDNGEDLTTLGEHFFTRLRESLGAKDLALWCLRTSRGYSITTKGKLSPLSSIHWGNLGMSINGDWLIVATSAFHKIGNESSLSQILEELPDQKYFLSQLVVERILMKSRKSPEIGKVCGHTLPTVADQHSPHTRVG